MNAFQFRILAEADDQITRLCESCHKPPQIKMARIAATFMWAILVPLGTTRQAARAAGIFGNLSGNFYSRTKLLLFARQALCFTRSFPSDP
ncbi:MAG TPA: hypothetical protein VFE46_18910 [Pirellulales bacterium]|nr:hypothetical protein [Pirellulales bacterium]